jgi:nicotinamide-nucleotide amidase
MNVNHVLVERLAVELKNRGAKVTVAESCTGGWIAKILTDFSGSSDWFEYGFVSYGNNAKADLLNIDPQLIDTHGAVSREVAEAMAQGALERAGADLAIAVTGVAGPTGGTPEKPVGTVWIAWLMKGQPVRSDCHHFDGDRDTVRRVTVTTALRKALEYMENVR